MRNKIKQTLSLIFGFTLIFGIGYAIYKIAGSFFSYISAIPKEIGAALIAGTATVIVATLTVVVAKYFERKRELDALHREKKTEIYNEFLQGFLIHIFLPLMTVPRNLLMIWLSLCANLCVNFCYGAVPNL